MWTGFATSIAAALAFPTLKLLEKPKRRPTGLFALYAIMAEFLMTIVLIWFADKHLPGNYDEEEVAITMLLFLPPAITAFSILAFLNNAWNRIPMFIGLSISLCSFILLSIGTWCFGSWRLQSNWWETGWMILGFGLLATLPLISANTDDKKWWRWAGVITSVISAIILTNTIWNEVYWDKLICLTASISIYITYLNLMLLIPLKDQQKWIRTATLLCALLLAILINVLIFTQTNNEYGPLAKSIGATGIVTACGTMAIIILAALNKRLQSSQNILNNLDMTIICPRCKLTQQMRSGNNECTACKLKINLQIEEPHCPECDYLLYHLTSTRCPECGTTIINNPDPTTPKLDNET